MSDKKNTLSGADNKRLHTTEPTNKENTAAWVNTEGLDHESRVNIPSEYDVEKAKNWVDNGSQL